MDDLAYHAKNAGTWMLAILLAAGVVVVAGLALNAIFGLFPAHEACEVVHHGAGYVGSPGCH